MKKARRVKKLIVVIALLTAMMMTACGKPAASDNEAIKTGETTAQVTQSKKISRSDLLFTDNSHASYFLPTNDPEFGNMAEAYRQGSLSDREIFSWALRDWPAEKIRDKNRTEVLPFDINQNEFDKNDFGITTTSVEQLKSGLQPKKVQVFFVRAINANQIKDFENADGKNPSSPNLAYAFWSEVSYSVNHNNPEYCLFLTAGIGEFCFNGMKPFESEVYMPMSLNN